MKSKKVREILERLDKFIVYYELCKRNKPDQVSVYKPDYKILRETMSSEQQKIYPHCYPHNGVDVVSVSR